MPLCESSLSGWTGNAWPLEQVFMEIISGNPNVNKTQSDLGMREVMERLDEWYYSRKIKKNKKEGR